MSTYGSAAYGSDSLGGGGGVSWQTFFIALDPLTIGLQSRTVNYNGSAEGYVVRWHKQQVNIPPLFQAKIYTHNSEGESPQLQATLGEADDTETVVGTRAFITVEIESSANVSEGDCLITGREVVE